MILSFGSLTQRTLHEREVIMSVAGVFVAHECGFQMSRGHFVLTTSIKGQTERDMRRCEARIALQSFEVSRARFTFFTLLVESQTFNVALFGAGGILRIGNRTRGGFEVRIVIDRRICSIPEQYAP